MTTQRHSLSPQVQSFFDQVTHTWTHVVFDASPGHAAVVDPVLGFHLQQGRTDTHFIDQVLNFIREQQLTVAWILETHAHADHLSAAPYVRSQVGGKIAMGQHIQQVQRKFKALFNLEDDFATDGSQFDHLFADQESFSIGSLTAQAWHVPGHTPADMAYVIGDAVFVGDTLFPPDVGTARCDFPGGDARQLFHSIQKLLSLPAETRLFLCHDYPTQPRPVQAMTTVADQRQHNIHIHTGIDEETFVATRQARDATLSLPNLMVPSVQVNIRAGFLPPPEDNGQQYLKLPVNVL